MIEKQQQLKKITEHELWDRTNRTLSSDHLNIYLCNIWQADLYVDTSRGFFVPLDFSTDYTVRKQTLIQQFSKLIP